MSTEESKAVARKWVEAFGGKDPNALAALAAPNFVDHITPPGLPNNIEGIKMQHGLYHTAFPDIVFTVERVVGEGDMASVSWKAVGKQTGPLQSFPATGKSATVFGTNVLHVVNGKAVDHWVYFDQMALLMQLGLVPAPH